MSLQSKCVCYSLLWPKSEFADVAGASVVEGAAGLSLGLETLGHGVVPLKWPQKPFASTASWKRREKIAQFMPEASSFGTDDGRVSARAVMVTAEDDI